MNGFCDTTYFNFGGGLPPMPDLSYLNGAHSMPFDYGRNPFNGFYDNAPGDMPALSYEAGNFYLQDTTAMLDTLLGNGIDTSGMNNWGSVYGLGNIGHSNSSNGGGYDGNPAQQRIEKYQDPVTGEVKSRVIKATDRGAEPVNEKPVKLPVDPQREKEKFDIDYLKNAYGKDNSEGNEPEGVFKDRMLLGEVLSQWEGGKYRSWIDKGEYDFVQKNLITGYEFIEPHNLYDFMADKFDGEESLNKFFGSETEARNACKDFLARIKKNHTDVKSFRVGESDGSKEDFIMEYAKLSSDHKFEVKEKINGKIVTYEGIITYNRDFIADSSEYVEYVAKLLPGQSSKQMKEIETDPETLRPEFLNPKINKNAEHIKVVTGALKARGRTVAAGCTEAEYLGILHNYYHGDANGKVMWWSERYHEELQLLREMQQDLGTERNPQLGDFKAYVAMYDRAEQKKSE